MTDLPTTVVDVIGKTQYAETAAFPAERGYGWTSLASVQNGNPLFWDEAVAAELTGGPVLPPTTLSLWMRPHHWSPGVEGEGLALQTHFDLKEMLELPEAIISETSMAFYDPVRPGDVISYSQIVRSISEPKTTKLGTGRFWVIDVEYRNQDGTLVGVESYTAFGYRR
jgi:acyl dehydratase